MLLTATLYALTEPRMPGPGVDPAYQMALVAAMRQGLQFGRDIVFTFGPLGFLHVPMFDPVLYPWNVGFDLALGVVLALDVVVLARRQPSTLGRVLLLAALPLVVRLGDEPDARVFLFAAVVAVTAMGVRARMPTGLLVANVALLSVIALIKVTFLFMAVGLVGAVVVDQVLAGRRAALALPLVMAACLVVLWIAAGQGAGNAGDFVRGGLACSQGYTEGMAIAGPMGEVGVYLLAAGMLVLAVLGADWSRGRVRAVLHVAVLAAILFLAFKNGFTRHLYHRATATAAIASIALLYAAARWTRERWVPRLLCVSAAGLGFTCVVMTPQWPGQRTAFTPAGIVASLEVQGHRLAEGWRGWRGDRRRWEAARASLRREHHLPSIEGTAEVLGLAQHILLAHDVRWKPRPVFQGYQALTPSLVALNGAALGDGGADTLVADVQSIDDRFPTLDLGPGFLELLRHYDVAERPGEFLALRRRAVARPVRVEPIARIDTRLGEAVSVPESSEGLLWARIEVEPTMLGRALLFGFRGPELELRVTLASGREESYRLIPSMASGGFLLSPIVSQPNALDTVMTAGGASRLRSYDVRRLVVAERPFPVGASWGSAVRIELGRVVADLPTAEAEPDATAAQALDLTTGVGVVNARLEPTVDGLRVVATAAGPLVVLPSVAPSTKASARTLVLDVTLPHDDTLQVYWRIGESRFIEDRSVRFQLTAGRHRLRVPVPRGRRPVQFRLDPGERVGTYELGVAVLDEGGAASSRKMSSSDLLSVHSG
ncbi:MAG TPA: hypothetical protein VGR62_26070 [Candidatus Binatia bacterium]|nr:hypothetical protein [Candidatus Binatia bacterium]